MTVDVYRSSDPSAPTLTGAVGSLLGVLDACLVNGYGSRSAAGWSKPFANSGNLGCYKNGAGASGFCLAVNDNAPGAGGAREARVVGFQSLSSVSAGSGQFPTAGQSAIGTGQLVVRKSTTADATARNWTIIADSTVFYMFIESGDLTSPLMALAWMFGDFFSYSATDTSNCALLARTAENSQSSYNNGDPSTGIIEPLPPFSKFNTTHLSNVVAGHFAAANFTNIGGSLAFGKHTDYAKLGGTSGNSWYQMGRLGAMFQGGSESTWINEFAYPNPPDNGLYAAPVFIHHNGFPRGYFKGLWAPLQHLPLNHNDTFTGTGNLSGKSFLVQTLYGTNNNGSIGTAVPCQCFIETSSTWS